MVKAFEKQIKAIEDQGKRQTEIKTTKKYTYDIEDTPSISKQKEIFNKLVDKTLEEITNLDEKVNSDNLIHRYKSNTFDVKFKEFNNAFSLSDKIRDGKKV